MTTSKKNLAKCTNFEDSSLGLKVLTRFRSRLHHWLRHEKDKKRKKPFSATYRVLTHCTHRDLFDYYLKIRKTSHYAEIESYRKVGKHKKSVCHS